MLEKVEGFIQKHNLFTKQDKLLIAVSGGADSVALTDVLHKLGYKLVLAHCNFHLRNEESDNEEKFVAEFAKKIKLELFIKNFDTKAFAKNNNFSIEMAARQLRYDWFNELLIKSKSNYIVTGHHADDNIETFFLNLIRGTGIKGLSGIKPKNKNVVRPLLSLSRNEIENYCQLNTLQYCTDSSNLADDYLRNHIRLNIIPQFEKRSPNFRGTMVSNMSYLKQVEKYTQYHIDKDIAKCTNENSGNLHIEINELQNMQEPKLILHEILNRYGFNSSQVLDAKLMIRSETGKTIISKDYILVKNRNEFIISKKKEGNEEFFIDKNILRFENKIKLQISRNEINKDFSIIKKPDFAFLDFELLEFPLKIRKWKKGDRFRPIGMKSFKKLSDFFIDEKYSLIDKQNAWLLESNGEIVWLIGKRIDDRYKVTNKTKQAYILQLEKQ